MKMKVGKKKEKKNKDKDSQFGKAKGEKIDFFLENRQISLGHAKCDWNR